MQVVGNFFAEPLSGMTACQVLHQVLEAHHANYKLEVVEKERLDLDFTL